MCQQQTFHLQNLLGVMASKRKRSCYDAAFKLKVVEFVEECGNRAAEHEYTISEKLVRDWRKAKESLLDMPETKNVM